MKEPINSFWILPGNEAKIPSPSPVYIYPRIKYRSHIRTLKKFIAAVSIITAFITKSTSYDGSMINNTVRSKDIQEIRYDSTMYKSIIKGTIRTILVNTIVKNKEETNETVEIEPQVVYNMTDEEEEIFLRVVEAEVTGTSYRYNGQTVNEDEMLLSKIRVAQVFLNRVFDDTKFSDITTLKDALLQENASSTFKDGRYYTVEVTDLTKEAVRLAMLQSTEDYSKGALFFSSGSVGCKYGEYIFTDAVGHSFFK